MVDYSGEVHPVQLYGGHEKFIDSQIDINLH